MPPAGSTFLDFGKALTAKPTPPAGPHTRSLSLPEKIELGRIESEPPSVDLYINFKSDSAELEPEGLLALKSLGQALQSQELKDARIQIVGHTNAKGSDAYNQELSERRAHAVRSLLVGTYGIDPAHLEALGRGNSELKDKSRPEDDINSRIEIRNVTK